MSTWIFLIENLSAQPSSSLLLGYLDPGTGSMLIQVLIAGLFSSLFFAKSSLSQVRDWLLFKSHKK